jgi:hypothetical protein
MDKVELAGSLVAQCWSTFIDESEKVVRIVKENADFLASTTLESLGNLFIDKRANRKFYYDEHARICAELHKLQASPQSGGWGSFEKRQVVLLMYGIELKIGKNFVKGFRMCITLL